MATKLEKELLVALFTKSEQTIANQNVGPFYLGYNHGLYEALAIIGVSWQERQDIQDAAKGRNTAT